VGELIELIKRYQKASEGKVKNKAVSVKGLRMKLAELYDPLKRFKVDETADSAEAF
jgi:hypothetical protein